MTEKDILRAGLALMRTREANLQELLTQVSNSMCDEGESWLKEQGADEHTLERATEAEAESLWAVLPPQHRAWIVDECIFAHGPGETSRERQGRCECIAAAICKRCPVWAGVHHDGSEFSFRYLDDAAAVAESTLTVKDLLDIIEETQ